MTFPQLESFHRSHSSHLGGILECLLDHILRSTYKVPTALNVINLRGTPHEGSTLNGTLLILFCGFRWVVVVRPRLNLVVTALVSSVFSFSCRSSCS